MLSGLGLFINPGTQLKEGLRTDLQRQWMEAVKSQPVSCRLAGALMPRAERLGDTHLYPTELPTGARDSQELPEIVFSLLIRGCHGDRSRRRHPLVWLYTDHLSWLIFIPDLGQSWYWDGGSTSRDQTFGTSYVCMVGDNCGGTLCVLVYRWGDRSGSHCCVCVMMCRGMLVREVGWCQECTW